VEERDSSINTMGKERTINLTVVIAQKGVHLGSYKKNGEVMDERGAIHGKRSSLVSDGGKRPYPAGNVAIGGSNNSGSW